MNADPKHWNIRDKPNPGQKRKCILELPVLTLDEYRLEAGEGEYLWKEGQLINYKSISRLEPHLHKNLPMSWNLPQR
jgi:hypothetical protein